MRHRNWENHANQHKDTINQQRTSRFVPIRSTLDIACIFVDAALYASHGHKIYKLICINTLRTADNDAPCTVLSYLSLVGNLNVPIIPSLPKQAFPQTNKKGDTYSNKGEKNKPSTLFKQQLQA